MDVAALRSAIDEDLHAGYRPMAVVATIGTTSTASVDPIPEISHLCREHDIWLHVDAAYGGAMGLLPEGRWVMEGVDRVDSIVINPHKWLLVPLDFSALYTWRHELLRAVFSLVPEYLHGDASRAERNYMDYGLQLGRRFRALKAWTVFRSFGREGIASRMREHIRLARMVASRIESEPGFELMAPVRMAVVCFRAVPESLAGQSRSSSERLDELNRRIVESLDATGDLFLTHTRLHGRLAIRLAVGNVLTTEEHLERAWKSIREEALRQTEEMTEKSEARRETV
jgi:aromatic-L-amino-acid decarboxylase